MDQPPEQQNLRKRLKPSFFSGSGFLGDDQRPIDEIVATDMQRIRNASINLTLLIKQLKNAYEATKKALGAPVMIRPGVEGKYYESMGRIPSPFRGDGVFEKGEACIKALDTGESLIITQLSLHLIEKYHFFQGHGCRYRIDPLKVHRILAPQ